MATRKNIKGFDNYKLRTQDGMLSVVSYYKDANGKFLSQECDGTFKLWRNGQSECLTIERIKYLANCEDTLKEEKSQFVILELSNNSKHVSLPIGMIKTYEEAKAKCESLARQHENNSYTVVKIDNICRHNDVIWESF